MPKPLDSMAKVDSVTLKIFWRWRNDSLDYLGGLNQITIHSSWKAEDLSQLWSRDRESERMNECEQLHVCQHTLWQQNGVSERWQCVKDPVHHGQFEDGRRGSRDSKTKNCWSLDFSPDRPMLDHWSNQQLQSIIFSTHFIRLFFCCCNSVHQSLLSDFFFLAQDTNLAWFFDSLDYSFLACWPYFEFFNFSQSFIFTF